ncbi:hypothetical protein [Pseudomonas sp.]|uniref:hypothetical protein n=1 Tax=Pseudomonas sp. TaxID=306 RepID=UPI003C739357
MRLSMLLLAVLTTLCSLPLHAQQSAVRPAGSPGTATPQPYAPAPTLPRAAPNTYANKPPLLKQPQMPALNPGRTADQDLPLLQQQRQRNVDSLGKPRN